jgi:aminoglycoside N3'-acetyltransferase
VQAVTREILLEILRSLGLRPGEGVMAHSAVHFLGKPAGGLGVYYEALSAVLGIEVKTGSLPPGLGPGTLAVPAFNFAFARGEPYDPASTPSAGMGVFSEYIRALPHARRTPHPLQSVAAVGGWAGDLAGRDTPGAFDPGSPFDRMLGLDFKLLLLGAGIEAVSLLHYCEQCYSVPYRYWKEVTGPVKTPSGWETRTYRMFARNLDLDPRLTLEPVQKLLEARGQWESLPLNYGRVSACRMADFVAAVNEFLQADPWALVTNKR